MHYKKTPFFSYRKTNSLTLDKNDILMKAVIYARVSTQKQEYTRQIHDLRIFAQMEREHLSERTKAGLRETRRKGKILGRPKGNKQKQADFIKKYKKEAYYLKQGLSLREIQKLTGTSINTIQKLRKVILK